MTGYQEVVTDPSYADQIVCFTAAMVGNYGVSPVRSESAAAHARAVVMREARGPALDGLAPRPRRRRIDAGSTRARSSSTSARRAHARDRAGRRLVRRRGAQRPCGRSRRWRVGRSRRRSRRASRMSSPTRVGPDRGRRLRLQALDPEPPRLGGRGRHRLSARRRRRRARRATTASCSRTAPATRRRSRTSK